MSVPASWMPGSILVCFLLRISAVGMMESSSKRALPDLGGEVQQKAGIRRQPILRGGVPERHMSARKHAPAKPT